MKGDPADRYEGDVLEGILLHRRIDAWTDEHEVFARSRGRLGPGFRRFAGILVDMFYDHALARNWEAFASVGLREFSDRVVAELDASRSLQPERMLRFVEYLKATDLLVSYRETEGIDRALSGISRRLRRPNPLDGAVAELERDVAGWESDFLEFFPQLLREVGAGS